MATYHVGNGSLGKIDPDQSAIDSAKLAAAAEIDEAFASAGYLIPVDASAVSSVERERFLARLAHTEHAIAAHILVAADMDAAGEPTLIHKEYLRARAWLAKIASRTVQLPLGLVRTAAAGSFAIIGDHDAQTDVDRVLDASTYMGYTQ